MPAKPGAAFLPREVFFAAAAAAVYLGGCSEPAAFVDPDPLTPSLPSARVAFHDGVEYRSIPVALRTDIVIADLVVKNRASSSRTVRFPDECVGTLRAYRHPAGGLVWDQRDGKPGCMPLPREVQLLPGDSLTDVARAGSLGILGFTTPEGDYRLTVVLQPVGAPVIELEVGVTRLERPLGIGFLARTRAAAPPPAPAHPSSR